LVVARWARARVAPLHLHSQLTFEDVAKAAARQPSMMELIALKSATKQDYDQNAALRQSFRTKRKAIQAQEAADQALLKKASLALPLEPVSVADLEAARTVDFLAARGAFTVLSQTGVIVRAWNSDCAIERFGRHPSIAAPSLDLFVPLVLTP
jgi:hypothetical protein